MFLFIWVREELIVCVMEHASENAAEGGSSHVHRQVVHHHVAGVVGIEPLLEDGAADG